MIWVLIIWAVFCTIVGFAYGVDKGRGEGYEKRLREEDIEERNRKKSDKSTD